MRLATALLPGILLLPAAAVRLAHWREEPRGEPELIPGTRVPKPWNYEDYTRGRTPWRVFPGGPPGQRTKASAPASGLPAFDPADREQYPEAFLDASPNDPIGHLCAPGGDAAGHYFYNVWDPELIPFIVEKGTPGRTDAAIVVAPGGGSIHLAWEAEGIAAAEWLNTLGISAFVLKYRVPAADEKIQLMDAQRAMVLVRGRAEEHGLNPKRIGFMGSSAGGKLGIKVGTSKERVYSKLDSFDANPIMPDFLLLLYPGIPLDRLNAGPMKTLPPLFLAYSKNDPCCPVAFSSVFGRLARSTSPQRHVQIVEYREGKHGWGDCNYYPQLQGLPNCHWHDEAEKFLRKVLGLGNRTTI